MRLDPSTAQPTDLTTTMAGVVAREPWAIAALFEVATTPVRGMVLARFQDAGFWVPRERLDDIVRDLVLELVDLAPGWRPDGGAKPWGWARGRLISLAFAQLGILADDFDKHPALLADKSDPGEAIDADSSALPSEILGRFAADRSDAALLVEALELEISERDRLVWLDALSEKAAGNRSPAVTVAQTHDISPALVRKICQRVRQRLHDLGTDDDRFSPLLGLPALAA